MADVASSFKNWSKSAASNQPTSSTVIGSGLAPNLQQIQATLRAEIGSRSSPVTAAGTVDLNSVDEGTVLVSHVSGTVSISSFGTVQAGIKKLVTFSVSSGTLTLVYNATSMIIPSAANIVIEDGDSLLAESLGSGNWKVHLYFRANGSPVNLSVKNATNDPTFSSTSGTDAASPEWVNGRALIKQSSAVSTSGAAAYDFVIPDGVKRVTVMFSAVSTNGTSSLLVQMNSESTGYASTGQRSAGSATNEFTSTAGFIVNTNSASYSLHGDLIIENVTANTYTSKHIVANTAGAGGVAFIGAGSKTTTATLSSVRLTTVNGTDLFDAGTVNVSWEF